MVANELSRALGVPLTIVDFQVANYPLQPAARGGPSAPPAAGFADWRQQLGVNPSLRVYVCRDPREAFGLVFRPHSLVVVGGTRRWWPTRAQRMRQALEAAGHFVLFVDEATHAA